jgi:hypothetical protein
MVIFPLFTLAAIASAASSLKPRVTNTSHHSTPSLYLLQIESRSDRLAPLVPLYIDDLHPSLASSPPPPLTTDSSQRRHGRTHLVEYEQQGRCVHVAALAIRLRKQQPAPCEPHALKEGVR